MEKIKEEEGDIDPSITIQDDDTNFEEVKLIEEEVKEQPREPDAPTKIDVIETRIKNGNSFNVIFLF